VRSSSLVPGPMASHPRCSGDHTPTTDLQGTPATQPALHRKAAAEPRWAVIATSGPEAPSPPGPHPNRAGGGDNNPVHGADGQQERCAVEEHLTTDLPENASGAASVTSDGEIRRRERPRGSSQPGPFVEHVTARALGGLEPLHRLTGPPYALAIKGDQEVSPMDPLTPLPPAAASCVLAADQAEDKEPQ
jgi:hypothetical protein